MKMIDRKLFAFLCLGATGIACAAGGASAEDEILATRGKGIVTQAAFDTRVARIPERDRLTVLRDKTRVSDLLDNMLLKAQLAADAREHGFDRDPATRARMKLAAEEELGQAWIEQYVNLQGDADYEQMALETWELEKDRFRTQETTDVSHILLGVEERDLEAAEALAREVLDLVRADPERFDELALEYSEDSALAANQGHYRNVKEGQMVESFEEAAFAMQPGQISDPVKTQYGYHIIRLDAFNPGRQMTFEEVHDSLVKQARKRHRDRVMNEYLGRLSLLEVEMTPDALEEMVRRQFGDDAVSGEAGPVDSE